MSWTASSPTSNRSGSGCGPAWRCTRASRPRLHSACYARGSSDPRALPCRRLARSLRARWSRPGPGAAAARHGGVLGPLGPAYIAPAMRAGPRTVGACERPIAPLAASGKGVGVESNWQAVAPGRLTPHPRPFSPRQGRRECLVPPPWRLLVQAVWFLFGRLRRWQQGVPCCCSPGVAPVRPPGSRSPASLQPVPRLCFPCSPVARCPVSAEARRHIASFPARRREHWPGPPRPAPVFLFSPAGSRSPPPSWPGSGLTVFAGEGVGRARCGPVQLSLSWPAGRAAGRRCERAQILLCSPARVRVGPVAAGHSFSSPPARSRSRAPLRVPDRVLICSLARVPVWPAAARLAQVPLSQRGVAQSGSAADGPRILLCSLARVRSRAPLRPGTAFPLPAGGERDQG